MESAADTIAAIATAPGPSALAVVRMSGTQALAIGQQFLAGINGNKPPAFQPRRTYLCEVLNGDGLAVDQAIVIWYKAPASYTGEDVLELTVHGGSMASRVTLEQCLRHGARPAKPGEFTLRAFLAGRLDLSQAEAVIETVEAQTQAGLRLAHRQLSGGLSSRVEAIRRITLGTLAQVEAAVDFPDDVDEPDRTDLANELSIASQMAQRLALEARAGKIYRDGIRLAIIGRPNVGKSSLLNALLREDRAIVTPIPGTTRDVIEETVSIGGVPIRALDTAGIHPTQDPVERIGVERALRSAHSADLCLLVLDRSEPLQSDDWGALEQTAGIRTLIILNKCDLAPAWHGMITGNEILLDGRSIGLQSPSVAGSLVEAAVGVGQGVDKIEKAILEAIFDGQVIPADSLDTGSLRHGVALEKTAESLKHARHTALSAAPLDLISIDVRGALQSLGEITGATAPEDLLHEIFSRFCIGK